MRSSPARAKRIRKRPRACFAGAVVVLLALYAVFRLLTGEVQEFGLPAHDGEARAIILVHGLDEPGVLWRKLKPRLETSQVWPVLRFVYPNGQGISESSRFLAAELRRTGLREVVFIAHSMGCLVVRDLLSEPRPDHVLPEWAGRVRGAVLLAPPNHGSNLARYRAGLELKEQVHRLGDPKLQLVDPWMKTEGEAGRDLTPGSVFLEALNAREWPGGVPVFMVVGYDSPVHFLSEEKKEQRLNAYFEDGERPGFPFPEILDGYGDGSVSITSALHPDFPEYLLVDAIHRTLVDAPEVVEKTEAFLSSWTD